MQVLTCPERSPEPGDNFPYKFYTWIYLKKSFKTFSFFFRCERIFWKSDVWPQRGVTNCEIAQNVVKSMKNHGKSSRTKSGIVILPIFKMIARFSKCDFWIPDKILSWNIYSYIFFNIFSMKKIWVFLIF